MRPASTLLAISLVSTSHVVCLGAAQADDFYKGKTINIVVGYAPGGGYDNYARLLGRHIAKHIPGAPTIIVQNLPGAASLAAANHVYAAAPKDGTVIAAVDQNAAMFELLGGKSIQYDITKVAWLGSMSVSNGVVAAWAGSGIRTLDDAKAREVMAGSTGTKDDTYIYARALNQLLGTNFKVIQGYAGTAAVSLAMEKGEVEAVGRTYYGFVSQKPDWMRDNKVNFLVQFGQTRQPELPNVPTLLELLKTDQDKQMAQIVTLPTGIGYAHWMSPQVPADRLEILRKAYADLLRDSEFLGDAEKQGIIIRARTPEELAAVTKSAFQIPQAIREEVAAMMAWE